MISRRMSLAGVATAITAALSLCLLALDLVFPLDGHMLLAQAVALALLAAACSAAAAYALRGSRVRIEWLSSTLEHLTASTRLAGISVWEWDLRSNRMTFAPGSILGLQLGGVTSVDRTEFHDKLVHPDDREMMQAAFDGLIHAPAGKDDRLLVRCRRMLPDGGECHVEIHARAARDAAGRVVRIIGMSRDVTAEVEATRALEHQTAGLRAAEQRLERASRSSLEGHWELCYATNTRWHSSSFEALLGRPPRETIGRLDLAREHTHPDDRAYARRAIELHIETGEPFDVTVRLEMADGSHRWFRMRGGATRDADGQMLRMAGSAQDVHQQKLAEDRLREVQARFERAVDGTLDGLWEIDLSGPRGRFWLSPRLCDLLGFDAGELSDDQEVLRDLIHPDDLAASDSAIQRLADAVPLDIEVRMRTKRGAYRWYRLRGRPGFDAAGRLIRTSGSMQDVTEARASREALVRATEAAQAANRAKSAFLATMSHEIRTPMNGIIGMTALLLDSVLGRVQREYAEAIRTSSNSLLAIINDILDFSKIEAGKLEIESLEMDVWGQVEEVGSLMALQAAMKSLELIVDVAPDVPQTVLGDPQRIRQCLVNLAGNAIKFTSTGEIVIAVRRAGERDGATLTRFEVRDTGIGIAPEARAELFQPFTQADSSTTRQFGGTGLGLSIVKHLAELMGGEVGVESEAGRGSTFWFTLPLKRIEPSGRSALVTLEASPCRVLIVDDNATNRRVLAAHLTGPYRADAVASAAEALERLGVEAGTGRDYDVALIDYQMPGMDGAMLGERIAGDPRLSRTRLVLLTSLDHKGDHTRFASMGFAAYLTKPVRPRELRDCLSHVLAHGAEEWTARTYPLVTRGTLLASTDRPPAYGGRVLVVEDNAVNQKVAQKFLERLGCTVRVAADGAEAVDMTAHERFDLILMDMQMPVMDGIAATRAIRAAETGGVRTPIVALTANVLAGQFQSCLDAGMDDVLAKPIEASRLRDILERFVLKTPAGAAAAAPLPQTGPSLAAAPLDLARLAVLAGDDTTFMRELLTTFRASAAAVLGEMQNALPALDRDRLRRSAHKLRGASDNIGATRLRDLAALVESGAAERAQADLTGAVASISAELGELDRFFSTADIATFSRQLAS